MKSLIKSAVALSLLTFRLPSASLGPTAGVLCICSVATSVILLFQRALSLLRY